MQIHTDNGSLIIFANKFNGALLRVVSERDNAIQVRNKENNRVCWIPKRGIKQRKPGVATYENEYVLETWFRNVLKPEQERALNLLE